MKRYQALNVDAKTENKYLKGYRREYLVKVSSIYRRLKEHLEYLFTVVNDAEINRKWLDFDFIGELNPKAEMAYRYIRRHLNSNFDESTMLNLRRVYRKLQVKIGLSQDNAIDVIIKYMKVNTKTINWSNICYIIGIMHYQYEEWETKRSQSIITFWPFKYPNYTKYCAYLRNKTGIEYSLKLYKNIYRTARKLYWKKQEGTQKCGWFCLEESVKAWINYRRGNI